MRGFRFMTVAPVGDGIGQLDTLPYHELHLSSEPARNRGNIEGS